MASTAQDTTAPLRPVDRMKDEDMMEEADYSPFFGIEKGAVLQEARIFHSSQLDARKCQQVITKLLYLLNQGETFTKKEVSEVFFAVTKLFQNKDSHLRRLIYLCIKELCPSSDEVIIVTSSLMKDMNGAVELYRSNAIRVICKIIDAQLLLQIERYLKQAIVDKSQVVASAVLVGAMHLYNEAPDVIKRWSNEIQEATQNKSNMVQYHAVSLYHAIRESDRLAISKLVSTLTKANLKSPLAQVLLVRYVAQVISEQPANTSGSQTRPFYDFLESCLRHKHEQVIFEAARAIAEMRDVTTRELQPAITVLQLFLCSSKPVIRFAAVRTLNKIAQTHPMAVTNCNIDMEGLIQDSNRSISTLAITTLLKTGNEMSVERLLKQIGQFISEIADDFKIVVVKAIQTLCLKYPQKHRSLMSFLSSILREEGGFEFKKTIVDSILTLICDIPEAREPGLAHLCEFIEDCEFTYLSQQILHHLGQQGPLTKEPAKYIRYIYNRTILENATVRAAAVSSLAAFGAAVEGLQPRVLVLLRRCLHDYDDEVRDRATLYLKQLTGEAGGPKAVSPQFSIPLQNLETSLVEYLGAGTEAPFDLDSVPRIAKEEPTAPSAPRVGLAAVSAAATQKEAAPGVDYGETIKSVPELANLGLPWKSCEPVLCTEEETEYTVSVIKHIYETNLVLQFQCTNTIKEQVLENVSVELDLAGEEDKFKVVEVLPLAVMPVNEAGNSFIILEKEAGIMEAKVGTALNFRIKEVDPTTGEAEEDGYDDEYQLEDLDITAQDYILPLALANFKKHWDELPTENERIDDYSIGQRESLQDAVEALTAILGLRVCEGTDAVPPNARSHTVLLAGKFIGDVQVLVRLSFGISATKQVAMKVTSRAEDAESSDMIHSIISEA